MTMMMITRMKPEFQDPLGLNLGKRSVVPVKREINLDLRTCIVGTMSMGAYRGYQIHVSR